MIKFSRIWAMPNKNTFDIPPIKKLIYRYFDSNLFSIDPFANSNRIATETNDLDPEMKATYCMDAHDFLKRYENNSVDICLYDPPYSQRQVSECYKALGETVNMETTQSSYWANHKDEIGRIVKPQGIVICCGWNSGGIGSKYGFDMLEILLVPHGGAHNDTIVTVERKKNLIF